MTKMKLEPAQFADHQEFLVRTINRYESASRELLKEALLIACGRTVELTADIPNEETAYIAALYILHDILDNAEKELSESEHPEKKSDVKMIVPIIPQGEIKWTEQ